MLVGDESNLKTFLNLPVAMRADFCDLSNAYFSMNLAEITHPATLDGMMTPD